MFKAYRRLRRSKIKNMFGKNNGEKVENKAREIYERKLQETQHQFQIAINELKSTHSLALKEKEFELRHFKDDEVKALNDKVNSLTSEVAVLKKENEMLGKITNLNADIIDIKDLVANLINKLPEIKLNNLTLQNGNSQQ